MGGKSIISNSYLEDIGDAIRYKKGTQETFYPSQMGDAIRSIEGIVPTGTMEIDTNGVYNVTEKAEAVVSVQPDLRPLSVSENGTYEPDGFDGYSQVSVDVPDKYLLSTHVLEEDKLSGAYASYWLRTYMPWCIPWEEDDMNLYMMTFEGNEASQYRATTCLINSFNHNQYVFSRSQTGARVLSLNIGTDGGYDFCATAGTIIKVYKFPPVI